MKVTGGEAIYHTLKTLGVKHVFGIVSVHNIAIYDAISRGDGITAIDVRHEQGALHAADGYARTTGRLGVAITSTGPGATNAMTGLFEAQFASSPVLMITGQTESHFYGKGKGVLHEAENQQAMLRTVTRVTASPRRVEDLAPALLRVARDVLSGRPQPGAIEIPVDLQYQVFDFVPGQAERPACTQPDAEAVKQAASVLAGTEKRIIWAGGGVLRSGAEDELLRLAERLQAPVYTSVNGRGAIPEDHPLAAGTFTIANRDVIGKADAVVAVGTRFQGNATANFSLDIQGTLIHIDADPQMIGLSYPTRHGLVCDARLGLEALNRSLNAEANDVEFNRQVSTDVQAARADVVERMGKDFHAIMQCIRRELPREGKLVRDATIASYLWGNTLLPILEPRSSIHSTSAAIGPGLPLALGASIGSGMTKVVLLQGDGGFMLNLSELATAAQYQVPVVICLFNDGGYGVLRVLEAQRFAGRNFGVDLHTPDFVQVAEAMGVKSQRVSSVEAFESAFAAAMADEGPWLLDIDVTRLSPMRLFN